MKKPKAKPPIYWFAATVAFKCPKCGKQSSETMMLHSSTKEPQKLNAAIERQKPKCSHCKYVLAEADDGTNINVDVQPVAGAPLKPATPSQNN